MKYIVLSASLLAAVSTVSTAPVYANDLYDVARARANARAGGPITEHDAWLLERYGALSGTRYRVAKRKKYRGYRYKRKARRRLRKRWY